jgi:Tfp pilus assembly protein PilV
MSTGTIIAIVVVVLIVIAVLAFVLPRMRRTAEARARTRELEQRRDQVAGRHRAEADSREREADLADRKARVAQAEAEKQRAEARAQQERAEMHERGMADDELIADHERERFAPALDDDSSGTGATSSDGVTSTPREGGRAHEPMADRGEVSSDYEQGRVDEREGRFTRSSEAPSEAPSDTRRP